MEVMTELGPWFTEAGRWSFTESQGVPFRTVQHLWVSTAALLIAVMIAVPPALVLGHARRAEVLASAVVNLGRAIPSFGLIVMFWLLATRIPWISTAFWPLLAALVALALPPIFTNAYTAVRNVDDDVIESARGMGYTERRLLIGVELPLSSPVLLAGVRLAFVQVLATTAIGAIVTNGGGLGRYIVDGFASGRAGRTDVLAGALLLGVVTLAADFAFGRVEHRLVPVGVRRRARRDSAPSAADAIDPTP